MKKIDFRKKKYRTEPDIDGPTLLFVAGLLYLGWTIYRIVPASVWNRFF